MLKLVLSLLLLGFCCGCTTRRSELTDDSCPDWEMSESAKHGKDDSSLTAKDRAGMKAWHDCEKAKMIADGCVIKSDDGDMMIGFCPEKASK